MTESRPRADAHRDPLGPPSVLGDQERSLVALLVGGHTVVQASRCLGIGPMGGRMLLAKVKERSGCAVRVDLVRLAQELGIDPIPPSSSCT